VTKHYIYFDIYNLNFLFINILSQFKTEFCGIGLLLVVEIFIISQIKNLLKVNFIRVGGQYSYSIKKWFTLEFKHLVPLQHGATFIHMFFLWWFFIIFVEFILEKEHFITKKIYWKTFTKIYFIFCFKLSKILTIATIRKKCLRFSSFIFWILPNLAKYTYEFNHLSKTMFVVITTSQIWGKKPELFWIKVWPKITTIVYNMKWCLRFSTFIFWVSPIFNKFYRYLEVKYVSKGV